MPGMTKGAFRHGARKKGGLESAGRAVLGGVHHEMHGVAPVREKGMRKQYRRPCLWVSALVWVAALTGAVGDLSPARAQSTADGEARAKASAKAWAEELFRDLPGAIFDVPRKDRRITFQPMDPRDVVLGSRQRDLVYDWMLSALRREGKTGGFDIEDPRDYTAVARALENTGAKNWFEVYTAALEKHRTRINLACTSGLDAGRIRFQCTARDTLSHYRRVGGATVAFDWERLYAPLRLDQAVLAMAEHIVKAWRGDLRQVGIVERRKDRRETQVTPLARHIAETLENRIVERRAAYRESSKVEYELKGTVFIQNDRVDLQVTVYANGRPVNAVREYVTLASVKDLLEPVRTGEVGETFQDCEVCPEMVVIPSGEYRMGSPAGEEGRGSSEGPLHEVRITKKLAVGRYEVTRREYGTFVKETGRKTAAGCWVGDGSIQNWRLDAARSWRSPGFSQGERHPVVCVSWEDARAYAKWLSKKTDKTYRLLSEAEWEYAARAGTHTSRYWGDGPKGQCSHANGADAAFGKAYGKQQPRILSCPDGSARTAEVGRYVANAWRLWDMLGNVWEWVEDCGHGDYRGAPADGSAWVSERDCETRVMRGGSWYLWSTLRSAGRGYDDPANRNFDTGFRVVTTVAR